MQTYRLIPYRCQKGMALYDLVRFLNIFSFPFQYEEAFQRLNIERDQLAQQYQQYIDQLNSQSTQLQTQVQPPYRQPQGTPHR